MNLINALLIVLPIGLTYGLNRSYSFMGNDVCYEPYTDVISDVDHVMSVTSCSVACAKDTCCSFMYNAESRRCITSSRYPRNITQGGCGWKYMVNQNECIAPGPFTPYAPNVCDLGYSYNPVENKCVTSCDTYGSTFGISEDYVIVHSNFKLVQVNSTSSTSSVQNICLDECVATTTFVCRSVEIFHVCYLSIETALTLPEMVRRQTGAVLLHRNCA